MICSSVSSSFRWWFFLLVLQNSDTESLRDIAEIMSDSDVSPFEIIHSGLVEKLLTYITVSDPQLRDLRLRKFLHVFLGCPVSTHG